MPDTPGSAAAYLARTLARAGLPFVPGLPGTTILEPLEALRTHGVPFVATRHEQSAAHMADALGRLGQHAGVVMVDIGPGLANTLSGVLAAHRDSSPMVVIAGTEERQVLGREVWHEMAEVETFRMVTRRASRVVEAEQFATELGATIRAATTGRPGPALLSVPKDLWGEPVADVGELPSLHVPGRRPAPTDDELDAAASMLCRSERPLLLLGSGAQRSRAADAALSLAERLDLPVATSPNGRGAISETHPCCAGAAGRFGNLTASRLLRQADTIVAVGCRLSDLTTAGWSLLAQDQHIVHVDINPDELGRNWIPELAIVADARTFLGELDHALRGRTRVEAWSGRAQAAERHRTRTSFLELADPRRVLPQQVIGELVRQAPPRHRLLMGSGRHQQFVGEWPVEHPTQLMYAANSGAMGFALPAAIAAALADPATPVICCLGDGDLLMSCHELETLVRTGAPVRIVVLNDFAYGAIRERQVDPVGTELTNPEFTAFAASFGIPARRVDRGNEIRSAAAWLWEQDGPCLLDVRVDVTERRTLMAGHDLGVPFTAPPEAMLNPTPLLHRS